ncbi:helix-turn-helix domain-containing protein [uncultured Roseibium sp.]|uniref:helix-turn-helix domain-containing protein n=1 Tax=uncultured Roseibium sp. TaxID=1936171 RepID=UPI0032167B53
MTDNTSIPSLHLDASIVGDEYCFDAWREAVRSVYDVNPLADGSSTRESVTAWLMNGLIFTDVEFSAQTFSHGARLAQDTNFISLQLYKKGGSKGLIEDQSWQLSPGDIHVYDFSREFYSSACDSNVVGVVIPHEKIGYDPALHPGHMVFSHDTGIGRFLANTLRALLDQLPDIKKDEEEDLASGFCGLMENVLVSGSPLGPSEEKKRDERRKEMQAYINRNLATPELGVAHLCRIFNISRPSVYREFAQYGGVANYITMRRLERAFYQLISVPFGQRRIKEVAYGVGFSDPAHFSRLFRQRFGMTPMEATNLRGGRHFKEAQSPISHNTINYGQLSAWLQSI